jgi:hypothetical protein
MHSSPRTKLHHDGPVRTRSRPGDAFLATFAGTAVGTLVAVATALVVLTLETADRADPPPTTPSTVTPAPSRAPAAAPPAKPAPARPRPSSWVAVQQLPTGLSCRELRARSVSYAAAIGYWQRQGRPGRMDANRNGIPCETVYSAAAVNSFW